MKKRFFADKSPFLCRLSSNTPLFVEKERIEVPGFGIFERTVYLAKIYLMKINYFLSITNMKSNSYKLYTPPCIEVEEVVFESAVLQSSTNSTTQSLDEETYNW